MPPEIISHLPTLPRRRPDGNKGNYGRILVIAGSRGMSGAAVLAGGAALRAGAGLVRLAVPEGIWPIVAAGNPCYMTLPLPQSLSGQIALEGKEQLLAAAAASDVVALGPGLGRSGELAQLVAELVAQVDKPLVLDADGLNAFEGQAHLLKQPPNSEPPSSGSGRSVVLTPHPGEFARLLEMATAQVQAARQDLAVAFARDHGLVLLLKGHGTIVTDGRRAYVNATGNPGMATAGSGDVLTGVIAALLGQGLDPFAAAQLGAYLHGLAGDLARAELGEESLVATDLVDHLPQAFLEWRG